MSESSLQSPYCASAVIAPLEIGGFVLPVARLDVSDRERQDASLETLADFICRHEDANELQARRNGARIEAGFDLQEFTMVSLVDTHDEITRRLAGRPAGAWWHDHLPVVTVCVRTGTARFALLLGQEYWPLRSVGPEGSGIRAASFFVPSAAEADLVLAIHVAQDSESVLDQPFATCTLSGPNADETGLRPFAWRHGTTIISELADAPFPGARQLTHYCDGISEASPHIVIGDGEHVWAAAQWLGALATVGDMLPVVVTGIIPQEPGTWAIIREQMLGRVDTAARADFDRAIDAAITSLGTVTNTTPVVLAGFSQGAVWAVEHALESPRANAVLGHAPCGPVEVGSVVRTDLDVRIVDCALDPASRTWSVAIAQQLISFGLDPHIVLMAARHSWETFVVAISDYVRDLPGDPQA